MINFETLGIPQELVAILQDKAIKFKRETSIVPNIKTSFRGWNSERVRNPITLKWELTGNRTPIWNHTFRMSEKLPIFGLGGLNFILSYVNNGYEFVEKVDNVFIFHKEFGDKTMCYDANTNEFRGLPNKSNLEWSVPLTVRVNNGAPQSYKYDFSYTNEQLADAMKISVERVEYLRSGWKWVFQTVDTETEVANAFSGIEKVDDTVNAELFINGRSWREYSRFGDLLFPFGKRGQDFIVDWVLYNEHTDSTPDWISEGNFGEGARVRYEKSHENAFSVNVAETDGEPSYDKETNTFYYNPSKEAVLAFVPTLLPAQGKNEDWEVLIDLKTGEVYYDRFKALAEAI
jgi:hypothetical protein